VYHSDLEAMEVDKKLNRRVVRICSRLGMTYAGFARTINVHRMTMYNITSRGVQRPGFNVLYSISKHLGINMDLMVFGSDENLDKKIDEVAMEMQIRKILPEPGHFIMPEAGARS
jgi:DNA-binding XRE family transcriptional regulator